MKRQLLLPTALCLCLLLTACNNQQESKTTPPAPEKTTAAASTDNMKVLAQPAATSTPKATTPQPAAPAQQGETITGKILETMNSGGYTYMNIDTGKTKLWVATPEVQVKAGDTVSCYEGMVMPNFTSKTLNKTFDAIVFSSGLVGQAPPAAPQAMEGSMMNNAHANPHAAEPEAGKSAGSDSFASAVKAEAPTMQPKTESGGSSGAIAPFAEIKVDKAAGENGYTVGEVFANNTKLDGKTVRVQGKVVKFSPNIMGKNWIHIQDGSGDPMSNTHDLVITTSAEPPKGQDIITIEGTVRANKDFGAGYSYVVLVEEAQIVK